MASVWLTLLLLTPFPLTAEQLPTFPADARLVTIDVVVSDRDGRPVRGLRREDFVVREDGKTQEITFFEAVARPSAAEPAVAQRAEVPDAEARAAGGQAAAASDRPLLVLVVDELHLTPAAVKRARKRLGEAASRGAFGAVDLYLISSARKGGWRLSLPEAADELAPALARFQGQLASSAGGRMNAQEAFEIAARRQERTLTQVYRRYLDRGLLPGGFATDTSKQRGGLDRDIMAASEVTVPGMGRAALQAEAELRWIDVRNRRAATLHALTRVMHTLRARRERKAVVLVSEGFVSDPAQPEQRELVEAARLAHAGIHLLDLSRADPAYSHDLEWADTVDLRDVHETSLRAARASSDTRAVALATGGRIVLDSTGLPATLGRLSDSLRSYYLVGYAPQGPANGRYHQLRVEVARPGLRVEARPGYYALAGAEAPAEGAPADARAAASAVAQALDSPLDAADLPVRLAAYVRGPKDGRSRLRLVAELATATDGPVDGVLRLTPRGPGATEERAFEGVSLANSEPPLRLEGDFEAPPGAYQAQVVLRERASGRLGSARQTVDVLPGKAFRASTLVLTDTVVGTPPNVSPVPHTGHRFERGKELHCFVEVSGVPPAAVVSAALDILDAAGRLRLRVPPSPLAAGQRSRLWSLPLTALEPGPYELLLTVQDTRTRQGLQQQEAFEVVPER